MPLKHLLAYLFLNRIDKFDFRLWIFAGSRVCRVNRGIVRNIPVPDATLQVANSSGQRLLDIHRDHRLHWQVSDSTRATAVNGMQVLGGNHLESRFLTQEH